MKVITTVCTLKQQIYDESWREDTGWEAVKAPVVANIMVLVAPDNHFSRSSQRKYVTRSSLLQYGWSQPVP